MLRWRSPWKTGIHATGNLQQAPRKTQPLVSRRYVLRRTRQVRHKPEYSRMHTFKGTHEQTSQAEAWRDTPHTTKSSRLTAHAVADTHCVHVGVHVLPGRNHMQEHNKTRLGGCCHSLATATQASQTRAAATPLQETRPKVKKNSLESKTRAPTAATQAVQVVT